MDVNTCIISYLFLTIILFCWKSPKLFKYVLFQLTSLIAAVVAGGYQIYFWTQRNSNFFKTRQLKLKIDDWFPFWPSWIWIYSFLYYILIGGFIIAIPNIERGVYIIFGGLLLLVFQALLFILFPAVCPTEWRDYKVDTISKKYLKFVQGFDDVNNCFPSMHCSLATYISLTLFPLMGWYCLVFAGLIGISTLFTKQHTILDVFPGMALGALVYWIIA